MVSCSDRDFFPVGIGAFANFIPEIGEIVGSRPKYGGVYKVEQKGTSWTFVKDLIALVDQLIVC